MTPCPPPANIGVKIEILILTSATKMNGAIMFTIVKIGMWDLKTKSLGHGGNLGEVESGSQRLVLKI
jgi:hypothetical protein